MSDVRDARGPAPLLSDAAGGESGALAAGDFERLAVTRIALVAQLGSLVGLVALMLVPLRSANVGVRAGTARPISLIVVGMLACLGLALVARSPRVRPKLTIDLALAVLVLLSLLASLYAHWLAYLPTDIVRGVSPVTVILLFFAAVIPVPPRRMAVAALLAVLADVGALAATVLVLGRPTPPWRLVLWLLVPGPLGALVAVASSSFLYRIGEAVRRARELGAYRLIEKIGQGGMGEVWRGEHRSLARQVAIKLVSPRHVGTLDVDEAKQLLVRFEREARATAALRSAHTVAVYDFGRASDGSFYYVMEHLEGMNLDELVRRHGRVSEARTIYLLLQVCDSLAEAHDTGLVHRDVKPANVFVSDRDRVKVLDFGLVKIAGVAAEESTKLTGQGAVLGTPAFMSPEAATGHEVTLSSDVYAFGCVAYWLLTGTLVFADKTNPVQQLVAHVMDEPEPPSRRAPDARIAPELEGLVLACLAKDPVRRPASFQELEKALRRLPSAAGWSPEDAGAWWRSAAPARTSFASAPTELAAVAPTAIATPR